MAKNFQRIRFKPLKSLHSRLWLGFGMSWPIYDCIPAVSEPTAYGAGKRITTPGAGCSTAAVSSGARKMPWPNGRRRERHRPC